MLVDNDEFLTQLSQLFSTNRGTIWLTHKRLTHDGEDATMKHAAPEVDINEYPCLLRATNGKEVKFSTQVMSTSLPKFHAAYSVLLKASLTTLRKRDKKREKQRAEDIVKRKRKMTEPIVVEGAKRGNGRRKRQRVQKAVEKQQISQAKAKEREEIKAAKSASAP